VTSESTAQYYPASNQFPPPPPAAGAYGGQPPQSYGAPPANPPYPEAEHPPHARAYNPASQYNPADYGPTNGPTLPPDDPYAHPTGHSDYRDEPRRDPHGPENVSSTSLPPGTSSIRRRSGRNASKSPQHRSYHRDKLTQVLSGVSYGNDTIPLQQQPLASSRSTTFPPPPTDSTTASSTFRPSSATGKSVQFTDDPPQSFSDSEIGRPTSRHSQGRRRSGKRASSPASDDSNDTIDAETMVPPSRTDAQGRPLRKDSVADAVEAFLTGRSAAGQRFNSAVDEFLGVPQRRRRGSEGRRRKAWDE
jgi:hypothetical protein